MKPLLSIVTITYNDPKGLESTFQSLLELSKDFEIPWEHVVVDSSPESNSPVFDRYPEWPLKRVQTIPRGIYPAFNVGIQNSTGQLVWFLNGGDCLLCAKNLKDFLAYIGSEKASEIFGAPVEIYRNGQFTYNSKVNEKLELNLLGENSLCHQGVIYRRSVFSRIGLFDESFKLAGDYEHFFRCYLQKVPFRSFYKPIAQFSRDGVSDNYSSVFLEYATIWKNIRPQLKLSDRLKNDTLWRLNWFKLRLMKSKLLRPIAKPLKTLWYKIH